MKLIKLAAAVLNQIPLDWMGNRARVIAALEQARQQGASVVCLPELCLSGYGCEDMFHAPGVHEHALESLRQCLPHTKGLVVSLGLPVMFSKGVFNMACLVVDGKVVGFVGKRFLAGDGIHYEPRWFKPWPQGLQQAMEFDGDMIPMGDLHFRVGGVKIGFEICEDAWVAERPGVDLARIGVDVILNPSASHFAFGKNEIRQRFVMEGSRAFGVSYVYANLLGNESGRAIFDGEAMIASQGKMLAVGQRFSFAETLVTSAVVDVDATRMNQARTASFQPNMSEEDRGEVAVDFAWPPVVQQRSVSAPATWESGDHVKLEEWSRAVPLALFDYMRKSCSHGFVVSLSGGADSAAAAVLVRLMVEEGVGQLGIEGFKQRLAYFKRLQACTSIAEIMPEMLTTAYQASANSGAVTRKAAEKVAKAVQARHLSFNISKLIQGYLAMVSQGLGRELTWQHDDIALQNIQARVRSPGIWMVANIQGALLLATSNRSEAAVGYATMDGDTSGGLSPLAGIDKAFLREWLRWMETTGPQGMHAFPALSAINFQAPTAELRPASSHQTDEDDLMPYPVLDAIERAAIRDKLMPLDVFQRLHLEFSDYDAQQMATWVERFFRLWCRNQWKRERYAPSFHVDDENLDPKTWCRFPILSSGFEEELQEMWAVVGKIKKA